MIDKPETKICTKCKQELLFTPEFFGVNKCKKPFGLLARCKKCLADAVRESNKDYQRKLRREVLTAYGKDGRLACVCCSESHYEFLCLDHIHGGGGRERQNGMTSIKLLFYLRRLGFPKGDYRTLCCNCHQAYTEHGCCPHQSAVVKPDDRERTDSFSTP